mgnify:CR=1 FL=1
MTQYFWSVLVSNLTSPATTGSADNTQSPLHTSLKAVYKVSETYMYNWDIWLLRIVANGVC